MDCFKTLIWASVFAGLATAAAAEQADEIVYRPYFGAVYEQGWLTFKTSNPYGKQLSGFAPLAGVSIGQNFALELSWRMAYGTGATQQNSPTDTTTNQVTIHTTSATTYHSSSSAIGMDFYVRYPLGHTGLTPFLFTGISIDKPKVMAETVETTVSHPIGAADASKDVSDTQKSTVAVQGKEEISPELGLGLAYGYGSAEIRVAGRVQNLNMGNSGQYMTTLSGGLVLHL
jgi:hypothetical protein